MTSAIDSTKPIAATPTTASVRANFLAAKNEIEALQLIGATIAQPAANSNGAFHVWQEKTSYAAIVSNQANADGWRYNKGGVVVHTLSLDTDVPTVAQAGTLAPGSLLLNLTTPDTSIAATDYCFLEHNIEGYAFGQIAQQPFTLSFWVKATLPGVYCCAIRNNGYDRVYLQEYTISAANTWEKKVIVVPASPTAGAWDYTNASGLHIDFCLAAGLAPGTASSAWQTGGFIQSTNQINGVNTGATNFRLALVKVEAGTYVTPWRPTTFDQQLAQCRRYYQKSFPYSTAPAQNASYTNAITALQGVGAVAIQNSWNSRNFTPQLRAAPTMTLYNPQAANAQGRDIDTGTDCALTITLNVSTDSFDVACQTPAGSGAGQRLAIHFVADSRL
jgi:hypothetical protein